MDCGLATEEYPNLVVADDSVSSQVVSVGNPYSSTDFELVLCWHLMFISFSFVMDDSVSSQVVSVG